MKTFTVLVLCIFALCCCQEPEGEGDAGSGGDKKGGKCKGRGPPEELLRMDKVCREKVKVSQEDMKAIREGWMKGQYASDLTEEAKCYIKCMLIEGKKMKEDGTPTLEELQQNVTLAAQKIGECNQIKPDSGCTSGYQVATCLAEARRMVKGI